jgi:hypothetical protein
MMNQKCFCVQRRPKAAARAMAADAPKHVETHGRVSHVQGAGANSATAAAEGGGRLAQKIYAKKVAIYIGVKVKKGQKKMSHVGTSSLDNFNAKKNIKKGKKTKCR